MVEIRSLIVALEKEEARLRKQLENIGVSLEHLRSVEGELINRELETKPKKVKPRQAA